MTNKKGEQDKHEGKHGGEATEAQERRAAKILAAMADKAYTPMKPKALAGLMCVPKEARAEFKAIIERLLRDGDVVLNGKQNLCLPQRLGLVKGIFGGTQHGYGFVTPEDEETAGRYGDIFIPASATRDALNKDVVLCRITVADGAGRRAEGEVVRIIKKGYDSIVGTYIDASELRESRLRELGLGHTSLVADVGVFYPLDRKIGDDIIIRGSNALNAQSGDKVMAKILPRLYSGGPREGIVTEVLGPGDEPGVDVTAIIRLHGIPFEWSRDVLEMAERLPDEVSEDAVLGRVDLRGALTVTIDGEDTKDVDDAVTIKRLDGGAFELGVHIADVAHYVREGKLLDMEARNRATSVYLADRVIPMLPPKLSNGICSLNEGCDRLALSCIMRIDNKGAVVSHDIVESVICVDRGLTYTVVNDIVVNGKDSVHYAESIQFAEMFADMSELASVLRAKRIRRGSVEFGFPEAKISVNERGEPTAITPTARNAATGFIEEFMVAANETVAEEYFWRELPFIYRTHEEPAVESIRILNEFLRGFGYSIKGATTHTASPGAIAALLSKVEATPEQAIISRMVLRSFRQARYTPENIGHFGLASKYYTHFTSPIRRYPDLMVHRVIKAAIHERSKQLESIRAGLGKLCARCSLYERRAETCERDVANLKKAQFMKNYVGQTFPGVISGVTKHGIYVELENTVEGMVSTAWLPEGYDFVADRMSYVGNNEAYSLGDKVRVEIKSVDAEVTHRVNFVFVD